MRAVAEWKRKKSTQASQHKRPSKQASVNRTQTSMPKHAQKETGKSSAKVQDKKPLLSTQKLASSVKPRQDDGARSQQSREDNSATTKTVMRPPTPSVDTDPEDIDDEPDDSDTEDTTGEVGGLATNSDVYSAEAYR